MSNVIGEESNFPSRTKPLTENPSTLSARLCSPIREDSPEARLLLEDARDTSDALVDSTSLVDIDQNLIRLKNVLMDYLELCTKREREQRKLGVLILQAIASVRDPMTFDQRRAIRDGVISLTFPQSTESKIAEVTRALLLSGIAILWKKARSARGSRARRKYSRVAKRWRPPLPSWLFRLPKFYTVTGFSISRFDNGSKIYMFKSGG